MFAQLPNCALGSVRLDEIDRHTQHGDNKDNSRIGPLPHNNGNDAGDQKDDDERIKQQQQQLKSQGAMLARGRVVRPKLAKAQFRFSLT
jgi:hypothetical protein